MKGALFMWFLGILLFSSSGADAKAYHVVVRTGDGFGAGTDATVKIKVQGTLGQFERQIPCRCENGFRDDFYFSERNIGYVTGMRVYRGDEGFSPSWRLDYITIKIAGAKDSRFNYYKQVRSGWTTLTLSCTTGNVINSQGYCDREQCGYKRKPNARIVGGTEATRGAWPWQAQVRNSTSGFTFCGGSLVHPRWVVTAAHCVSGKSASSIRVRLGAHYRSRQEGTEQDFQVERIVSHNSYNRPYRFAHDIALLKLRTPAQINKRVSLVCLPGSVGKVSDGKLCWVTGYGRLFYRGPLASKLMQVQVPIVSESNCRRAYGSRIHDSMVCAGLDQGGKDSCQGDSGGPMVCEYNGRFYLEGVVSWGNECALPRNYGVYVRVRYLRQWIDSTKSRY